MVVAMAWEEAAVQHVACSIPAQYNSWWDRLIYPTIKSKEQWIFFCY